MSEIIFKDRTNRKQKIDILFEGENMIVVNKSPNLPVIPDRYGKFAANLRDLVNAHLERSGQKNKVFIVHRIDVDTSGVVLLAKNEKYHSAINSLFEERKLEKTYLAIVTGIPVEESGTIDKPILKLTKRRDFGVEINPEGKPSITEYQTIEKFSNHALIELKPKTGRMHQIRVHLQAIGNPLLVDPLYSKIDHFSLAMIKRGFKKKKYEEPRPLCSRLTLHAYKLSFTDPITGEKHSFNAEIPKDLRSVINALRKYN